MKIQFCGGARYVTGSSHLLTLSDGYKILLDCGLFQGRGKDVWEWNNNWLFDPKDIDCVVLSHAHIDHCGLLPKLVKDGFKGEIYCTHATRSLCGAMLLDSAKIQESDATYYNNKLSRKRKKNFQDFRTPLYTSEEVITSLNYFASFPYDKWVRIRRNVELYFTDAGHILGSAAVTLRIMEHDQEVKIGFTGDIGRPNRPILRDPVAMPEVDFLICESTYGNRDHESEPEQYHRFLDIIKRTCIEKKGKLIIPAFSLGRTQELVYMLDKMSSEGILPDIPVIVDSPLAINVTQIYRSHPECFDQELHDYLLTDENPFGFNRLKYVSEVSQSKALNDDKNPSIIISASGMMNAGRIRHHLFNNIENPKNTFLIVGYCSPETPGGMLRSGAEKISIFYEEKEVLAEVEIMDSFSAHGDRNEMLQFIAHQKSSVKKVFLVHGEPETMGNFKSFLTSRGFKDIMIPNKGEMAALAL